MGRIKINELDNYRFMLERKIYLSNINIAGHVGSVEMTELFQEARYAMMKSMGISDLNLGDGQTGGIMVDIVINFKGEIFLDDVIMVEIDISEIDEKGYRVFYRALKNGKIAAIAETGFVTFSFREKKVVGVPSVFIEKLNSISEKQFC